MTIVALDASGAKINLSTTTDVSGNLVGATCITDPVSGNKQTVTQLHNADKQNLSGASLYGALESGTTLLIDPVSGLADRQRETGVENATSTGIATSAGMLLAEIAVNSGSGTVGIAGPATITPVAMSGTLKNPAGGDGWSIQIGTVILYDVGGANQEAVEVTALTATTFTATFAKTHAGGVAMLVRSYYQARQAPGLVGGALVSSDGVKATYRYFVLGTTPAATPTDIFTIAGSATRTIRIKKIALGGIASTAGQVPYLLIRRSTADTGGTSTNPTAQKHDSGDPAATATLTLFTANPGALGTTVGTLRGGRLFHGLTTAQNDRLVFNFCDLQDKAVILRGATDVLAINGNTATLPAGTALDIDIEFEEDES